MEFRQAMRRLHGRAEALDPTELELPTIKELLNVVEVDKLFDKLDLDHSGQMEEAEIKAALKKLQDTADEAAHKKAVARNKGALLHARASRRSSERHGGQSARFERRVAYAISSGSGALALSHTAATRRSTGTRVASPGKPKPTARWIAAAFQSESLLRAAAKRRP